MAYWADEGVDWFKAYTRIGDEELAAAIDEAHRRGVRVTGHLCSISFQEAVDLGIDNIEHGFFSNSDYVPGKEPGVCPPGVRRSLLEVDVERDAVAATIRAMVEGGVAMTSTLAVYELAVPNRPPLEDRVLEMLAPGARDEYLASPADVASRDDAPMATLFPKAQRFEKLFADAGGLLAAGVDPTGMGGALPGYGDQRNYELLLEAGFTPEQVIQVMTLNGARVLGEDARFGSVEAGKLADLIVIDGDPVRPRPRSATWRWSSRRESATTRRPSPSPSRASSACGDPAAGGSADGTVAPGSGVDWCASHMVAVRAGYSRPRGSGSLPHASCGRRWRVAYMCPIFR